MLIFMCQCLTVQGRFASIKSLLHILDVVHTYAACSYLLTALSQACMAVLHGGLQPSC
jgi:hypothetical protein